MAWGGREGPRRAATVNSALPGGGSGGAGSNQTALAMLALEARLAEVEDERASALIRAGEALESERDSRKRAAAAELEVEELRSQLLAGKLSMQRLMKQLEDAGVGTIVNATGGSEGAGRWMVDGGLEEGLNASITGSSSNCNNHLALDFFPHPLSSTELTTVSGGGREREECCGMVGVKDSPVEENAGTLAARVFDREDKWPRSAPKSTYPSSWADSGF